MEHFDLIVVGSGPAGATAAFHAAKSNLKVAIIEKEILPRYKVCGGGLVNRGRLMLPFDISEAIEKEFNEFELYFHGTDIRISAKREKPVIFMVMRDQFDHLLVKEGEKLGVQVFQGNAISHLEFADNILVTTTQTQLSCTYLIAADGAYSPTAKLAGWKTDSRKMAPALEYEVKLNKDDFDRLSKEVRVDIDFIKDGYAWSFPKKEHISIGLGMASKRKVDMKKLYADYLSHLGIKEVLSQKGFGFQIPISMRKEGFVKNNVVLIGDAAGFADPLTGEGISNAIYSAKLAAESVIHSHFNKVPVEDIYNEKLSEKLVPELKTASFLSNFMINFHAIRTFFIRQSGEKYGAYMTDIFLGEKSYPKDLIKTMTKKIKQAVLKV